MEIFLLRNLSLDIVVVLALHTKINVFSGGAIFLMTPYTMDLQFVLDMHPLLGIEWQTSLEL